MTTQAIITGNRSRHRLEIGSLVEVISKHTDYYMCKGSGIAHYCIPFDEITILNLN